ncbi:uncharacterized protein [Aegilops tauschii subsp. strangulata]|uniref:uncharacterized protein n=1 Tax=Aegilops tauschii subsp. strangulata TaxID=200361 RepID=UPI00098B53AA
MPRWLLLILILLRRTVYPTTNAFLLFFNAAWDVLFPDSSLASRPRITSDHFPLLVSVSTRLPPAGRFFFVTSWLLDPGFLPAVLPSWTHVPRSPCAATRLARQKKCLRFAAKVWKRQHKFLPVFDNNCKFLIDLIDFWEECRRLSMAEEELWRDARLQLAGSVARQAAYWRQRGKCWAVAEGDENTGYFHARASHRRRCNAIRVLAVDGVEHVAHQAKEAALRRFYSALLGRAPAAWPAVADDLQRLFDDVHRSVASLDGINRALIALLPKKEGVPGPGDFRPVSLQNGDVKILCWGLTSGLQLQIGAIIDEDQSGFLSGRSISENFVYAAELVQCCHRRGAPTLVFKLDFAKAFDSITWPSLRRIMEVRGFPALWCDWMDLILRSSKAAVLLNGVPGCWFAVRNGLLQGDPISPYLFLLAADVLQRMIRGDGALSRLRIILDLFAAATGLVINFYKSTLVPMNVEHGVLASILASFECTVGYFPQSYLGLPLSSDKLKLDDFAAMGREIPCLLR